MGALRSYANLRQEKSATYHDMAVHRRRILLNLAFSTWRDLFCPNVKELQKKTIQAARFWKVRILLKALESWCKVRNSDSKSYLLNFYHLESRGHGMVLTCRRNSFISVVHCCRRQSQTAILKFLLLCSGARPLALLDACDC